MRKTNSRVSSASQSTASAALAATQRQAWMGFAPPEGIRGTQSSASRSRSADLVKTKQDSGVGIDVPVHALNKEDSLHQRTDEERELNPERINLNRKDLRNCIYLPNEDRLRLLNYQSNFIARIENLDNLTNLVFLDFYNNSIHNLEGFDRLANLRVLMLGRNKIQKIQGLDKLLKLDVLDIHSNQISKIENLSHLTHLRVLNLEDNTISCMERLPSTSLAELNLKRNQITKVTGVQTLTHLKRLILSHNHLSAFDNMVDLLLSPSLLELSMEQNPITTDQYYRLILANRIKSLKYLDSKRISEEEKRTATRIAKRETERRKESERVLTLAEERKRAIENIQGRWERDMEAERRKFRGFEDYVCVGSDKDGSDSDKKTSARKGQGTRVDEKGAGGLMFTDSGQMFMYGIDSLALVEKADLSTITSLSYQYIDMAKLAGSFSRLKRGTDLELITFSNNNINSLKKLDPLSALCLPRPFSIVIENNSITASPFFFHYALFRLTRFSNNNNNVIKTLNGVAVTQEMVQEALVRFCSLRIGSQLDCDATIKPGSVETCDVSREASAPGSEKMAASSFVDTLMKEVVETNRLRDEFDRQLPDVLQACLLE
ncbi:Leucine-rich repeat-containing protein 49 [Chytriomyces hyalinus]|nr:Leucine-rich repeat-containing protein 49 [Chytriomyces hyalinus]